MVNNGICNENSIKNSTLVTFISEAEECCYISKNCNNAPTT